MLANKVQFSISARLNLLPWTSSIAHTTARGQMKNAHKTRFLEKFPYCEVRPGGLDALGSILVYNMLRTSHSTGNFSGRSG